MAKVSQKVALYQPKATRRFCSDCQSYRSGACTIVEGQINPGGTCKLFMAKK